MLRPMIGHILERHDILQSVLDGFWFSQFYQHLSKTLRNFTRTVKIMATIFMFFYFKFQLFIKY